MTSPKPPTISIVDSIDDFDPDAMMMCASGAHPNHDNLGSDYVSGHCSQCNADIHFSIHAPTGIPKVCTECGLADAEPGQMAITEQTMDELLTILGLPDRPEIRALLVKQFQMALENKKKGQTK